MKPVILCYSKCTTCKKALKWLDNKGIEYDTRPIKEEHPTEAELTKWIAESGLPIKRFFNTSGILYKEMHLKDKLATMTNEEQIHLLATDGMLVKRPLVVSDALICPGFKEELWEKLH